MNDKCPSLSDVFGFLKFPDQSKVEFTDPSIESMISSIRSEMSKISTEETASEPTSEIPIKSNTESETEPITESETETGTEKVQTAGGNKKSKSSSKINIFIKRKRINQPEKTKNSKSSGLKTIYYKHKL
jgi:hypothetical protein